MPPRPPYRYAGSPSASIGQHSRCAFAGFSGSQHAERRKKAKVPPAGLLRQRQVRCGSCASGPRAGAVGSSQRAHEP